MPNIALFGTSADPPTTGHQAILTWLSWHFDWVSVWASDNPFKSHPTSLSHRIAMLQLLIDEIQPARHNIHLDPTLGCPRTYHTLEIASQRWKDAKLTFVIGSDLIFQLPNWYRIDEVLEQVDLLVIPRPGYPVNDSALAELRRRGARVTIADLTGPDISSTAYREGGETEGLTPPIAAYIHREHLYAWQDNAREKQPIR
ncbi:nicotinate-nucleotide adenylyltransferase [Kovacikia minuta CCNUW1]|uniref:nicotinate-nucleotide adenylyltransferase n=1 Tax=Kovacikia minuta TaxID=2931930 RepID=UPI001CC91DC8|nr:nicotinate-nucleotide adenylyltransferase [Kovacikia minuta]UBF24604.1 nicotinate-nucleotide adenylyltransferase [Kovacikia minuta CCNUW1]